MPGGRLLRHTVVIARPQLVVEHVQWSPWWLGDLKGPFYDAAVRSIEEVRHVGVFLCFVGVF